jgi:cob(I)alamin adenosyltransferase
MKIYTRTGDEGLTGLFGGVRLRKDDPRVDAYGTIDELNASLGLARALGLPKEIQGVIEQIQSDLFVLGAEIACAPDRVGKLNMRLLTDDSVKALEKVIDEHEAALPELKTFILPAGSQAGAALHLARTVGRRAERRCLSVDQLRPTLLVYLNRLSDCLFVLARRANHLTGAVETPWTPRRGT